MMMTGCIFFCNDAATTKIYPLALHSALPISDDGFTLVELLVVVVITGIITATIGASLVVGLRTTDATVERLGESHDAQDRKSTRLNSSHANISYAVFCLKKKLQQLLALVSAD